MRKVLCMIMALALCASLAVSASAVFTPSVENKGHPDVVAPTGQDNKPVVDEKGNTAIGEMRAAGDSSAAGTSYVFEDCLLITSVADAQKSGDKLEAGDKEAHDELLDVYNKLESGEMKFPFAEFGLKEDKAVIRDLFDGSWLCEGKVVSVDEHHPEAKDHAVQLGGEDGKLLHVTLDLGVARGETVHVFTYKNHPGDAAGEKSWDEIVDVVNNGDGTVTLTFEHLCPIAIVVENVKSTGNNNAGNTNTSTNTNTNTSGNSGWWNPKTGDLFGQTLPMWIAMMTASAVALVAVCVVYKKRRQ